MSGSPRARARSHKATTCHVTSYRHGTRHSDGISGPWRWHRALGRIRALLIPRGSESDRALSRAGPTAGAHLHANLPCHVTDAALERPAAGGTPAGGRGRSRAQPGHTVTRASRPGPGGGPVPVPPATPRHPPAVACRPAPASPPPPRRLRPLRPPAIELSHAENDTGETGRPARRRAS